MKTKFVLALFLMASGAFAGCPTNEDLTGGIEFRVGKKEREVFHLLDNGLVHSKFYQENGEWYRFHLIHGVYPVEFAHTSNGKIDTQTRTTYVYRAKRDKLPLRPNSKWKGKVKTLSRGGNAAENHKYIFGKETKITYGKCSYSMIPFKFIVNDLDDEAYVMHYLPELGISYVAISDVSDPVKHNYHSIRALAE